VAAVGIVLAITAPAAITAANSATAAPPPDNEPTRIVVDGQGTFPAPPDAADGFYRSAAQHDGTSFDDAVRRWGWADQLEDLTQTLSGQYGDIYASTYMNPGTSTGAEFQFTTTPPSHVLELLKQLPVDSVVLTQAPFTAQQQEQIAASAHAEAGRRLGQHAVTMTSYHAASDVVEVLVSVSQDDHQSAELANALAETAAVQLNLPHRPDVHVTADPSIVAAPEVLRGGVKISTSSGAYCTSGWPVDVSGTTSNKGLVTAGHCRDDLNYYAEGDTRRYALNNASRFLSKSYGDMQYHRSSGESVGSATYVAVGDYRQITGYRSVSPGTYLCLFGRTTKGTRDGKSTCERVYAEGVIINYPDYGEVHGLVSMEGLVSEDGDSGGPWFSTTSAGVTAAGVHSGKVYGPFIRDRSLFSPIVSQTGANNFSRLGVVLRDN